LLNGIRAEENPMGAPATNLAPTAAPARADDLDETALARWWAQTGSLRSSGAVKRRLRAATLPATTPVSPDPAPPAAQDLDDK
jgi:hypothetical protein